MSNQSARLKKKKAAEKQEEDDEDSLKSFLKKIDSRLDRIENKRDADNKDMVEKWLKYNLLQRKMIGSTEKSFKVQGMK